MYAHALPRAWDTETNTLGTRPAPSNGDVAVTWARSLHRCVCPNHYKKKTLSFKCQRKTSGGTRLSHRGEGGAALLRAPSGADVHLYCARARGRAGATSIHVSQGCCMTESEPSSELGEPQTLPSVGTSPSDSSSVKRSRRPSGRS